MRFLTTFFIFVLIFIGVINVRSQSRTPQDELAETAKEFFSAWLLRGDIDAAAGFVSSNPVLGKCMTPDYLERKRSLTNKDISGVFRKVFEIMAEKSLRSRNTAKPDDLSKVISSQDTDIFEEALFIHQSHSFESYFKIRTMRQLENPLNVRYVCKFDERRDYRERVSRADVYYLVTTIDFGPKHLPMTIIILWVKEGKSWRILTLQAVED